MPTNVASLEQLLLLAAGGVLWWLGGIVKTQVSAWITKTTESRRQDVDARARLERKNRELQEEVYALRASMLKSGLWTLEDLEEYQRRKHRED